MNHGELVRQMAIDEAHIAAPERWRGDHQNTRRRVTIEAAVFAFGNGLLAVQEDADDTRAEFSQYPHPRKEP